MSDIRTEIVERAAEKLVQEIRRASAIIPQPNFTPEVDVQTNIVPLIGMDQDPLETLTPDDLLEEDANFIGLAPGSLEDRAQISRDSAKGVIQSFMFAAAFHGSGQTPPVMRGLENCLSVVTVDGVPQVSFDANLLDFAVRNVFRESRTLTNSFKHSYFKAELLKEYRAGGYRGLPALDCWAETIRGKTIVFVEPRDFFEERDSTQMLIPEWACPEGPISE